MVVRLGNGSAAKVPSFIALHKLFGEVRQRSMMDLLAERVVQLGGTAESTIQVAAKCTELKEYPPHISGERDDIDALSSALAAYARVRVAPSIRPTNSATPQRSRSVWTNISDSSRHISGSPARRGGGRNGESNTAMEPMAEAFLEALNSKDHNDEQQLKEVVSRGVRPDNSTKRKIV